MVKRFYKTVQVAPRDGKYAIQLDAHELKTPAKNPLHLASAALAEQVAAEWEAQDENIDTLAMPVMRLVSTALDRVALEPEATAEAFAAYGMSDLLFYRAAHPERLVARQKTAWDPLLEWARTRFDMSFQVTQSILPIEQAAQNKARFAELAHGDVLRLTGLAHCAALLGSAILALALDEQHISAQQAYELAFLDDLFQIEDWGEDEEAMQRLTRIQLEIETLSVYLTGLKSA
jgi:chaperone required for assembly of F1-ATPase